MDMKVLRDGWKGLEVSIKMIIIGVWLEMWQD